MFKKLLIIGLMLCVSLSLFAYEPIELPVPDRAEGQTDVLELRTEPLKVVRVAFVGVGNRGYSAVDRITQIAGVEVTAICDVNEDYVRRANNLVKLRGKGSPTLYTGPEDWKKLCEQENVDLVYNCTHWALHTPIAVYAMEQGKHTAIEVPAATTIEECWQLVDTAERTRRHCMMLENTNYDFFELATLNMAQQGFFGEIVHAEGAYIHDLRSMMFDNSYWEKWRLQEHSTKRGNLYPTHGLGPLAHIMNIHRGDKFNTVVAMASNQFGMTAYAQDKYGKDSKEANATYLHGDINTSIIKTENGKTILIQHDEVSPRPYSRLHTVSGTKGFAQKYPSEGIAHQDQYAKGHAFFPKMKLRQTLKKYEHPIVKEIGQKAKRVGGHGGMDFMMDFRLIFCIQNGLPLDQDVYDAAEWSALTELSRISIENNGAPVVYPDFTRGAWNKVDGLTYYYK